jgi:hypothetical protein
LDRIDLALRAVMGNSPRGWQPVYCHALGTVPERCELATGKTR